VRRKKSKETNEPPGRMLGGSWWNYERMTVGEKYCKGRAFYVI